MSVKRITVAARRSPLSRAQVEEVQSELVLIGRKVQLESFLIDTSGDIDRTTSLRSLDKTDFFTKEVDALVQEGKCDIAIHSAKDLPEKIPHGLVIVALTKGLDPSDSLVLRKGESLASLPLGAVIATSSKRREDVVRSLRSDLQFIDLRGTIEERLAFLNEKKADGVVVAEAALIRLKLTHYNRVRLPGDTVPLQGQLAIVARKDDEEMVSLFSCLDVR